MATPKVAIFLVYMRLNRYAPVSRRRLSAVK